MYDVEFLPNPSAADLDALTDLWETSVRATHDFLAPDEICFYRSLVRGGALSAVRLWVVRRPGGGPGAGRTGPGYRIDRHAKYDNQADEYGARLSDA